MEEDYGLLLHEQMMILFLRSACRLYFIELAFTFEAHGYFILLLPCSVMSKTDNTSTGLTRVDAVELVLSM
jgi:hypothetical protein